MLVVLYVSKSCLDFFKWCFQALRKLWVSLWNLNLNWRVDAHLQFRGNDILIITFNLKDNKIWKQCLNLNAFFITHAVYHIPFPTEAEGTNFHVSQKVFLDISLALKYEQQIHKMIIQRCCFINIKSNLFTKKILHIKHLKHYRYYNQSIKNRTWITAKIKLCF